MTGRNQIFIDQLPAVLKKYPNLKILQDGNGMSYLKGILDIPNDLNDIVGSFLVEIRCSKNFPYQFPVLYEVGGVIPNVADWHKYKDESCCITFWSDEKVKCKHGITVFQFIEQYAVPYLANQIYRKQVGCYKNGEYKHGASGIGQYYTELMGTSNMDIWDQYCRHAFSGFKVKFGRNNLCFCGSQKKYKNCHLLVFDILRDIGEERVRKDFEIYNDYLNLLKK